MPRQVLSERAVLVDTRGSVEAQALVVDHDADVVDGSAPSTERRHGERLRRLPSTRERKRAENRSRVNESPGRGLALEFQCECVRPNCPARLPLEVERHRRSPSRYIVCVAHADADTPVGVADRFLIVETRSLTVAAHTRPVRASSRGGPSAA
jgi:hypothetical protein